MKTPIPGGDGDQTIHMLDLANKQVARSMQVLNDLLTNIETDQICVPKEVAASLAELRKTLQFAMETKVRLDDDDKKRRGVVQDYALDFDYARTEIGRRLDRLRASRGAG
jgi:D-ribose pyranose/furanose isomerase RbsD